MAKQRGTEMRAMRCILLLMLLGVVVQAQAADQEAAALRLLLQQPGGIVDPLGSLQDWLSSSSSPCHWTGVGCDSSSLVVSLDLHSRNLSGSLPDTIGSLSSLVLLDVSDNAFTGPLPTAAIASLAGLTHLDIGVNQFSGSLPPGLSALRRLQHLRAYNNNFTGPLPSDLGSIAGLEVLDLAGSYFEGEIPPGYAALSSLVLLRLSGNALTGQIPNWIGNLTSLKLLDLGYNVGLSGSIPASIGDISELEYLGLAGCNLTGTIPPEIGKLKRCNSTFLFNNRLEGELPTEIGSMSGLMSLDVSDNRLSGTIPASLASLSNLTLLSLMINNFSGEIPGFIGELPNLQVLKVFTNGFTGSLPASLGTAKGLTWIDASTNQLTGSIPSSICDGGSLIKLEFFSNKLSGGIPDLRKCTKLVRVRLQDNRLSGPVPAEFGSMKNLSKLELADNLLEGRIPIELAASSSLSSIDLSGNRLTGSIPGEVFRVPQLRELFLSRNGLEGSIPRDLGQAVNLQKLDLSFNLLTGDIPDEVSGCKQLIAVDLRNNKLTGEIPSSLAMLPVLATVDFSVNMLSGRIPEVLEDSDTLESFNVSFNKLQGRLPTMGIFKTESSSSFAGNPGLCGGALQPCSEIGGSGGDASPSSSRSSHRKTLGWIMALVVASSVGIVVVSWKYIRDFICKLTDSRRSDSGSVALGEWKLTAFQRLGYSVFDILECLKDSNVVGKGAAGTVYKAQLKNGDVVAVKKLVAKFHPAMESGYEQHQHVHRGFLAEVNLLGGIRHRNIVRLLGCCSNGETSLLIYEYMPNGSLAEALHGRDAPSSLLADWVTRYNVAVGVAQGLCYLHHDCFPQIVHRDVKSSNILLDTDMDARVADFGVAKLMESSDQPMSVVAGSYGYIPPEYAYTMRVDTRGDVYSFGVVLLELLTGKRPVEPEFGDNVTIVDWVRTSILQQASSNKSSRNSSSTKSSIVNSKGGPAAAALAPPSSVLDPSICAPGSSVEEEMTLVLRIALLCTSRLPRERPSMRDVVTMLSEAQPRRKESFPAAE